MIALEFKNILKTQKILMAVGGAVALVAVYMLIACCLLGAYATAQESTINTEITEEVEVQVLSAQEDSENRVYTPKMIRYGVAPLEPETIVKEAETEEKAGTTEIKYLDIPLDQSIQAQIMDVCHWDMNLYCFVMAIARSESHFKNLPISKSGCIGMMQVMVKYQKERMKKLGVTNLMDPVQNVRVAVDILDELSSRYKYKPFSHEILMAYNMGAGGARKAINRGIHSTKYSQKVMNTYKGYLEEIYV